MLACEGRDLDAPANPDSQAEAGQNSSVVGIRQVSGRLFTIPEHDVVDVGLRDRSIFTLRLLVAGGARRGLVVA